MQCMQNQTLLCERDNLMQTVTVLTSLCEPSTRQSLDMWLKRQCSTFRSCSRVEAEECSMRQAGTKQWNSSMEMMMWCSGM